MSREIGDRAWRPKRSTASARFSSGQVTPTRRARTTPTALRLASEAGSPREQARAHSGLARAYQADGDSVQARHHWREALTRYAAIGAPEAREIRARLATANDDATNGHVPAEEGEDRVLRPGVNPGATRSRGRRRGSPAPGTPPPAPRPPGRLPA